MAEETRNRKFSYNGETITIINIPDSALENKDLLRRIVQNAGESGTKAVDFDDAEQVDRNILERDTQTRTGYGQQDPSSPRDVKKAQQTMDQFRNRSNITGGYGGIGAVSPEQQEVLDTRNLQAQMVTGENNTGEAALPATSLKNIGGEAIRELGEVGAAAGLGFILGGPVGALGATAIPSAVKILSTFATNIMNDNGMDQLNSEESVQKFFDMMGVPEAKNKTEEFMSSGFTGVSEAIKFIGPAKFAKAVMPVFTKYPAFKKFVTAMGDSPVGQLIGGFTGGLGGKAGVEGAAKIAEEFGLDENEAAVLSTVMGMGGAMIADMSGQGMASIAKKAWKKHLASGLPIADEIQKMLTTADNLDIPVYKADIPGQDIGGPSMGVQDKLDKAESISGGIRNERFEVQNPRRRQNVMDVADTFGVTPGTKVADEMAAVGDDFVTKRTAELDSYNIARDKVIAPLSGEGAPMVDTTPTMKLIDSEIARLSSEGNALYKPVTDNMETMKQAVSNGDSNALREAAEKLTETGEPELDDVAKTIHKWAAAVDEGRNLNFISREMDQMATLGAKRNKPIIDELITRKGEIGQKDLQQIEDLRKGFGSSFASPELSNIKSQGDKVLNGVYTSLREDMGATIKANGTAGQYRQFEDAMEGMATLTKDLNDTMLKALIDSTSPEATADIIKKAISKTSTDDMAKLYPRLSPVGQEHARTAMVTTWMDKAGRDVKTLSPNAFKEELKDFAGQRGILFSQEQNGWLDGMGAVLEQTSRAEKEYLAKMNIPGDGTPGVTRITALAVMRNPIITLSSMAGFKSIRGKVVQATQGPEARDLMIKYGQMTKAQRASTTGEALFKRLGESVRATIAAEEAKKEKESIDNRSSGQVQ